MGNDEEKAEGIYLSLVLHSWSGWLALLGSFPPSSNVGCRSFSRSLDVSTQWVQMGKKGELCVWRPGSHIYCYSHATTIQCYSLHSYSIDQHPITRLHPSGKVAMTCHTAVYLGRTEKSFGEQYLVAGTDATCVSLFLLVKWFYLKCYEKIWKF